MASEPSAHLGDEGRKELLRIVEGLRGAIASAVTLNAPPETLRALAEEVHALGRALAPHAGPKPMPRYAALDPADPNASIPFSPITGRFSPLAPPVELTLEGEEGARRVVGQVRFSDVYEGPPSAVHGAIIASVYDQILAVANLANGVGGPTASLTVKYRKPTPLHSALRFEAWTERVDGRKVFALGRCFAEGELVTESEGLFVCLDAERARKLWTGLRKSEGGDRA